ncbi:adenylyltransferase/cytidyltransferase family protein [Marimonas lutisalis]|uniref:adenylyltransferase/cytidyltransferase family protein n=1 Tax=Marimonas lutisalis TaxID=2545756 RepID=UPI0010F82745|nr:adenylyltransferase/cytidyltransferase family protein [Marimonas lutisalis]
MTRVLTYGTFDLFHHGHVRLLERLAALGDELYVGCSTDAFNALKGKKTALPYRHRVEVLEACRHVTHVFPEECWEQKRDDVQRFDIDVFGMGSDWKGEFDFLGDLCKVVYLPRTRNVSTTEIKDMVYDLQHELRLVKG